MSPITIFRRVVQQGGQAPARRDPRLDVGHDLLHHHRMLGDARRRGRRSSGRSSGRRGRGRGRCPRSRCPWARDRAGPAGGRTASAARRAARARRLAMAKFAVRPFRRAADRVVRSQPTGSRGRRRPPGPCRRARLPWASTVRASPPCSPYPGMRKVRSGASSRTRASSSGAVAPTTSITLSSVFQTVCARWATARNSGGRRSTARSGSARVRDCWCGRGSTHAAVRAAQERRAPCRRPCRGSPSPRRRRSGRRPRARTSRPSSRCRRAWRRG